MTPLTCGMGSTCPSVQSLLVTVNDGTWGRKSYGFGGVGRSAIVSLSLGRSGTAGRKGSRRPLATLGRALPPRPSAATGGRRRSGSEERRVGEEGRSRGAPFH